MHEEFDPYELQSVANKMAEFERRCEEIMRLLNAKRSLSHGDREQIASLYRSLKEDLKEAAKYGTVTGERRPRTSAEQCFYDPAVRRAAIDLRPATNTNPVTSRWFSAVHEAQMEFSYYRHSLESTRGTA